MQYPKHLFFCFFFLVFNITAPAQNHLGLMSSIQYGNIQETGNPDFFNSNLSLGLGIAIRRELSNFYYLTGIISYQKVGYYLKETQPNIAFSYYWKAHSINLCTDLGILIVDEPQYAIGGSIGLIVGQSFNQEKQFVQGEYSKVDDYFRRDNLFLAYNLNLDLLYALTERTNINLRPNWRPILHSGENKIKERNLGVDLIVLYNLTRPKQKDEAILEL